MDPHRQIEAARQRFARSLAGRWSAAVGSSSCLQGQLWEIRPDGTGRFIDTGSFYEPRSETLFQWRQAGDFVFEMRLTGYVPHEPDDTCSLDSAEMEWRTLHYEFVAVQHDAGVQVGLAGGLFSRLAPLAYLGPL